MTDYRSFVESKLAELDRRRTEIEAEREQLTMTLGVMDEADAALVRHATPGTATSPALTPVPAAIVDILRSSGQMTADDIYSRLLQEREVTRPHLYSALHRLKKRNTVFKTGKMWGLVKREDGVSMNSVKRESTLLTNPTAP